MLQQFAGVPLEKNLQNFQTYADEFEKLPIFYLAFHGQQHIKVVMEVSICIFLCSFMSLKIFFLFAEYIFALILFKRTFLVLRNYSLQNAM